MSAVAIVVVTLLCVVQLAFAANPGDQVPLPQLPASYNVAVSANIINKGYSVGWEEWYDSSKQLLRADGRFDRPFLTQVVDFKSQTMTVFANSGFFRSPYGNCEVFNSTEVGGTGSFLMRPVAQQISFFYNGTVTYVGQATSSRGVQANVYSSNVTFSRDGATVFYTSVQQWTIGTDKFPTVPLNIEVDGWRVNGTTVSNFSHRYTFLKWSVSRDIPASIFAVPVAALPCPNSTQPIPMRFRPVLQSQVVPAPLPQVGLPVPALPKSFQTFVEIKRDQSDNPTSPDFLLDTPVWSFSYDTDPLHRKERLDSYDSSWNTNRVDIWNYQPYDANTWGRSTSMVASVDAGQCQFGFINSYLQSPLSKYRSGFVPELFANPGDISFARYLGRVVNRGLPADAWRLYDRQRSVTNSDGSVTQYNFTSTIYFYPQGWQWPERGFNAGFQPPQRVVNQGNYTKGGVRIPYEDIWDFTDFILQYLHDPNQFNANSVCSNVPSDNPVPGAVTKTVNNSNYNAAIGVAVFFAVLSALLVAYIAFMCYKRGRCCCKNDRGHTTYNN